MEFGKEWSGALLKLVQALNNFDATEACSLRGHALFYINGQKVGVIPPSVLTELENYSTTFTIDEHDGKPRCIFNESLSTSGERSDAFSKVLSDLREKNKFISLKGWRNETYPVYHNRGETPLCDVERSGCSLFGFTQYGVHINGYTYKDGELMMWIGRRSKTKQTFPDMLDNMCAGGLASGLGVRECAVKESQEEASVDDESLTKLKSVGALSYFYEDERGIFPETEYVFDLELSAEFTPRNADGEMEKFYLYSVKQLQEMIIAGKFKPNCALVVVDFLVRHGYITPDNEPNYLYLVEMMHKNLQPAC